MSKVTFIHPNGQIQKVECENDASILKIALDHGIPMENACGGNGFCTTCMCDIDSESMKNLSPRNDREENMGVTDDPMRLGCQAEVQGDVTVRLLDV